MIVEGRSRLANEAEEKQYREQQALAKAVAEKAELAKRVQVAIVAEPHKPVDLPEQVKSPATKK
ncbi:MAG: hypothetical protein JOY54_19010 [Acidobacteriaceae bacterium]|nr:hypothetical protein [Acidobacteriaceae bacterium]